MKYVIIGGVAAGASAAARLRRLDEQAEIVLLEKGSDISYANCGLPYHVGGVIAARARLSVMPPAKFASWFNVDVRTNCEATAIDRAARMLRAGGRLLIADFAPHGHEHLRDEHEHRRDDDDAHKRVGCVLLHGVFFSFTIKNASWQP